MRLAKPRNANAPAHRAHCLTRIECLPKRKADFMEPMECALVSALPEGSDWTYEVKLDGYRAIGVKSSRETILYSRNHKNFNKRFPQIAEALRDLPDDTVIDGEVVALDESGRPDFHRLQHFTAERSRMVSRDGRWLEIFRVLFESIESKYLNSISGICRIASSGI